MRALSRWLEPLVDGIAFLSGAVVLIGAVASVVTLTDSTARATDRARASALRWAAEAYPGRVEPARARCGSDGADGCGALSWCDVDTDGAIVPLCCDATSCRLRGPVAR